VNELATTNVISTQVSWQTVPNSRCSNMESEWTVAFALHTGLSEFSLFGWPQHCTALDRSHWTTDAVKVGRAHITNATESHQHNLVFNVPTDYNSIWTSRKHWSLALTVSCTLSLRRCLQYLSLTLSCL